MKIGRKSFLRGATLGVAGLVATSAGRGQPAAEGSGAAKALPRFDEKDAEGFWRAVREQYPLTRELAYFNTGGLGPACRPALDAMAETTRRLQERSEHGHGLFAGARKTVAAFLGAEADEVAFVRNATEGNAIVAAGVSVGAGDEVIFESHAHPGGSFPWLQQRTLRGVVVKIFEPDANDPPGNVERIRKLMTKRTRVVQVSHITAPTGIVMPAVEIAKLCRERGVWLHLDAAQSVGMVPVSVRALGCDSLATSGHKWLGAPLETGMLWVARERIAALAPTLVGAYSGDVERLPDELKLSATAERYEYGTRNSAAAVGLAAAVKFQEEVGRERIAQRGRALAARVAEGLAEIDGVEVLSPRAGAVRAAMTTFRCQKVGYNALFGRLLNEHAIRVRPVTEEGLNGLRVSTHCFNSPEECERLIAAVGKIVRGA